ncbi:MAG: hypothetical protein IJB31_01440 [Akkermansia sp.]|nr:hypothetical protein [Akkermansia sp.]
MSTNFADAIRVIMSRHPEYAPDAYDFMRQALDFTMEQQPTEKKGKHLDAQELYLGTCAYALEQYGTMAREVLAFWGVNNSSDVGDLVYNLIEVGVFGKQEGDTREQFDHLPPMEELLIEPFLVEIEELLGDE